VSTAREAVYAKPAQRPTYIGHDLRALHQDSNVLAVGPQPGWRVDVGDGVLTVGANGALEHDGDGDGLSIVRAVASAVWGAQGSDFQGRPADIRATDDRARDALERWSLMHGD
jgi:glycerol-1-phosphatase